jgi:UDP-glucose 4-epimerase
MNTMRLLITGGAGCLGSNLVERYLPQSHNICVIDNFATGRRDVLTAVPGLTLVEGSIADANLVNTTFAEFQPTHVIHSAAAYKDPDDWREDVATNVLGAIHVAKASLSLGVRRFINFQTALCYGMPSRIPIPADSATNPFTSYGISKTAGEAYLLQSGLPIISLRLANICGPRLAIGPIPTFYKRLKAGQSCFCSDAKRDFLDMTDFFSLINKVLQADAPSGAVFNVSSGEGHSILEVFYAVAHYLGISPPEPTLAPPATDDVPVIVLDPSETHKALGWKAKIGFAETIVNQLRWYDECGVGDISTHLKGPCK